MSVAAASRHDAPDWHVVFFLLLPSIQKNVSAAFRHLHGEARDEAVQEAVANVCVAVARLAERGQTQRAFATALAQFAIGQVREGRRVGTSQNIRDVLSNHAARKHTGVIQRLDRFEPDEDRWVEAVVADHQTSVPDQVCFRIDFPDWLNRLTLHRRQVALSLADGNTTEEVARQFRLSPARISQLRRELRTSWQTFHGDHTPPPGNAASGHRGASRATREIQNRVLTTD